MTSEIEERVYDGEVVEEDDFPYELVSYEDHENAMISERQSEDKHRWRQCRIASSAVGRFERGLIKDLAKAAGLSPQSIYDYARAWRSREQLMAAAETAPQDSEDYGHPETLAPTHHVEISYAPPEDRASLAREVENDGRSAEWTRQRAKELREEKERAEASGRPQQEETRRYCASCHAPEFAWGRMPESTLDKETGEVRRGG